MTISEQKLGRGLLVQQFSSLATPLNAKVVISLITSEEATEAQLQQCFLRTSQDILEWHGLQEKTWLLQEQIQRLIRHETAWKSTRPQPQAFDTKKLCYNNTIRILFENLALLSLDIIRLCKLANYLKNFLKLNKSSFSFYLICLVRLDLVINPALSNTQNRFVQNDNHKVRDQKILPKTLLPSVADYINILPTYEQEDRAQKL